MAGSKTRSKKEKASAKNAKGQQKTSIKASGYLDTVSCSPANSYNPNSGTFHTVEIPLGASSPPFHDNGHFKNTDDTDEHSSSPHGTESEYDSVSNNGSCSGESQESKDKVANSNRQESVPGLDNEKREKIRLKNEKKHQRQKERRAQELHERCSRYLMSRKLEVLSQQLVAMGFSHERATLALVLNEGKLEASVNWLFEANEEEAHKESAPIKTEHLNIDITEELAQISALEMRYKCSRQEVEKAIVAYEGDLMKAEKSLEAQKRESPATMLTPEEPTDAYSLKIMQKKTMLPAPISVEQKRNELDPNFAKTAVNVPLYSGTISRNLQPTNQAKVMAERRWPATGSNPTVSSSMASPMTVTPQSAKLEARLGVSGNEARNHQQLVREPVVMMQRPQSINPKQNEVPSFGALPSVTGGWYPVAENVISNGKLFQNQSAINHGLPKQITDQYYQSVPYKDSSFPFQYSGSSFDPAASAAGLGGSWSTMGRRSPSKNAPSLVAPSSLGLFTSYGSSPHVDWNTGGSVPEFDYTCIDWTLDSNLIPSKSILNNSSSIPYVPRFQDGGAVKEMPAGSGLPEWTPPFGRKDMFSVPSLFVTSPAP